VGEEEDRPSVSQSVPFRRAWRRKVSRRKEENFPSLVKVRFIDGGKEDEEVEFHLASDEGRNDRADRAELS